MLSKGSNVTGCFLSLSNLGGGGLPPSGLPKDTSATEGKWGGLYP